MTDIREGRAALKVVARTSGSAPASAGRAALKVIAAPNSPAPASAGRVALKVIVRRSPYKYYDGASLKDANLLGWWDGTQIRPITYNTLT